LSDELKKILADQRDFNLNFFQPPSNFDERSRLTKEYVLYLHSELDELLRHVRFKRHRDEQLLENRQAVLDELTDIFKYLLSLYIVWDADEDEILQGYWHKSMVVRQRYSEEFLQTLDADLAVIDIDNVLCDYTDGVLNWILVHHPELERQVTALRGTKKYLNSYVMQMDEARWQEIKHEFRVAGGKVDLPVIKGAVEFTHWLRHEAGLKIVLLTSRPIDEYPNIYGQTLRWLENSGITYDFIWWAMDKSERLARAGIRSRIRMAVDDSEKFIWQFADLNCPVYWFQPRHSKLITDNVFAVKSFDEIKHHWRKTHDVDR
jgi:hypothetical protein